MLRPFQVLMAPAEAAETAPAPAADEGAPSDSSTNEAAAWEAAKANAVAAAQDAAEAAEAEAAPAPTGKPAKAAPKAAAKPRNQSRRAAAKPAPVADEQLEPDAPTDELVEDESLDDSETQAPEEQDEELGDPEPVRPKGMLERLRLKKIREQQQSEWQRKEAEYQERLASLERRLGGETSSIDEAKKLYREGKVDDALEKVFGEKFTNAQQRFLEGKGALSRTERELAELKAERAAEKARAKEEAERAEQARAQQEREQSYIAERTGLLEEAATSPYREIRALATSPVKEAFADLLMQSVNTPAHADRDMKFHYQVARNAYRELYSGLNAVFGQAGPPSAPGNERESPARARVLHEKTPARPGVSAEKPQPTDQAEARGGNRRFANEKEAWEAHTRALRIG